MRHLHQKLPELVRRAERLLKERCWLRQEGSSSEQSVNQAGLLL
jgi:hypothetical protein